MSWIIVVFSLFGGAGLVGAAWYLARRWRAMKDEIALWKERNAGLARDNTRITGDYKAAVEDFRKERSSLEGAVRVLRLQKEHAQAALADVARRHPDLLTGDYVRAELQAAAAAVGTASPAAEPAVPGSAASTVPAGDGGKRDH